MFHAPDNSECLNCLLICVLWIFRHTPFSLVSWLLLGIWVLTHLCIYAYRVFNKCFKYFEFNQQFWLRNLYCFFAPKTEDLRNQRECLSPFLECLGLSPRSTPSSSSLLVSTLGGSRGWLRYLGPCPTLGNLHGVWGCWLQPGLAGLVGGIWGLS